MRKMRLIQVTLLSFLFLLASFSLSLPTVVAVDGDSEAQEQMQVDVLHELGYKGDGVTVAIIDTGLIDHEYFIGTSLKYYNVSYGLSYEITNWNSPYIGDPDNVKNHGTRMFGYAKQFAPEIDLVFYGVGIGEGTWDRARDAFEHLADNHETLGVDVLSISMGKPAASLPDEDIVDDIDSALDTLVNEDVTVFISSGNENFNDAVAWPSWLAPTYDGMMSVGAVYWHDEQEEWKRWWEQVPYPPYDFKGTNYGDDLEICAVGVDVLTTDKTGGWSEASGTSVAAPIAAASAACLIEQYSDVPYPSQRPSITPAMIEDRLRAYAVDANFEEGEGIFREDIVIRPRDSMINWYEYVHSKTKTYGTVDYFVNLQDGSDSADFIEELIQWNVWTPKDTEGFSSGIPGSWSVSPSGAWFGVSSGGKISKYAKSGGSQSGSLISGSCNTNGGDYVKLEFWYKTFRGLSNNFKVYVKDKYGNWDLIFSPGDARSWTLKTWTSSSSQYRHANFQVKYYTYGFETSAEWVGVDEHKVSIREAKSAYKFQHQFEWTGIDGDAYDDAYLQFSIGQRSGSEDLKVEINGGYGWSTVADYLDEGSWEWFIGDKVAQTTSTILVRITAKSETSDSIQDQWDINYLKIRVLHSDIEFDS